MCVKTSKHYILSGSGGSLALCRGGLKIGFRQSRCKSPFSAIYYCTFDFTSARTLNELLTNGCVELTIFSAAGSLFLFSDQF